MSSGDIIERDAISAAFDALDAAIEGVAGLCFDALAPRINHLARQASIQELGATLDQAIADRLRISHTEAGRRVKETADLAPRHGLTGEPLPPVLAATAAAQARGELGAAHVAVIRRFFRRLFGWIDPVTRERVEAELAGHAAYHRPDELDGLAHVLEDCVNPSKPWKPNSVPRACATPTTTPRVSTAPPARPPSTVTPNTYHHPEKLLHHEHDDDEEADNPGAA